MFKFKVYVICIIALVFCQLTAFAKNDINSGQSQTDVKQKLQKNVSSDIKQSKSSLVITPHEVNIGVVAFDKSEKEYLH